MNERLIRDLPLNGRNYTDLALLQPGVIAYAHRDGGSVVAHGLGTSINGQDPRFKCLFDDGTPLNDFTNGPAGSAAGTALGVETIREFRVEANSYGAEFGRNFGGQINAVSKSGTNSFHGSLYEFHRNDNFDARNFFERFNLGIQHGWESPCHDLSSVHCARDTSNNDSRRVGRGADGSGHHNT